MIGRYNTSGYDRLAGHGWYRVSRRRPLASTLITNYVTRLFTPAPLKACIRTIRQVVEKKRCYIMFRYYRKRKRHPAGRLHNGDNTKVEFESLPLNNLATATTCTTATSTTVPTATATTTTAIIHSDHNVINRASEQDQATPSP